ncbi:uncharacterized protein LOC135391576 [Ornithodoros turicata]
MGDIVALAGSEDELQTVYEIRFADDPTEVTLQRRWTPAITEQFILLRHAKRRFFNGKRNTTKALYAQILDEIGLRNVVSADQARKKWNNLMAKYRVEKAEMEKRENEGNPVPEALVWPYFKVMDMVMKDFEGTLAVVHPAPQPQYVLQRPPAVTSSVALVESPNVTIDGVTYTVQSCESNGTEQVQMLKPIQTEEVTTRRRRRRSSLKEPSFEDRLLRAVETGNTVLDRMSRTVENQGNSLLAVLEKLAQELCKD